MERSKLDKIVKGVPFAHRRNMKPGVTFLSKVVYKRYGVGLQGETLPFLNILEYPLLGGQPINFGFEKWRLD